MKNKPAPMLNPATMQPVTLDDLTPVFCRELCLQELDNDTKFFDIPNEIRELYKMYRPSPLMRAYRLEEYLGTPAHIYYKFEGNNTSGSHKLNSRSRSSLLPKQQGLVGVTTENGPVNGEGAFNACSFLRT